MREVNSMWKDGFRRKKNFVLYPRKKEEKKAETAEAGKEAPEKARKKKPTTVGEAMARGEMPRAWWIVIKHMDGHIFYLTQIDMKNVLAPCYTWKQRQWRQGAAEALIFYSRQEAMRAAEISRGVIRKQTGVAVK